MTTTTTPRAALPLLAAAQAQKHVTHNDALLQLDALLFARFLSRNLSTPPATPADGDTYLVKATASGAWTGQNGQIAYASGGVWRFAAPFTGLTAYVVDEARLVVFNGTGFVDYASTLALQNVPLLGVNASADATNKFAVSSSALLFNHVGNGVQVKLNKNAATDTASFLYQTGFSARAEIGLTGDDNFHFKVSPDGAVFHDAIQIAAATGDVTVTGAINCVSINPSGQILSSKNGVSSGCGFLIASPVPGYGWKATTQSADNKLWDCSISGASMVWRAINDAETAAINWLTAARSGIASVAVALNASLTVSGAVTLSPGGTGTVTIAPAGALTINPAAAGAMNNVAIGATTPSAGKFTTLSATGLSTCNAVTGIVARAGGGQASATALTANVNEIDTVTTAADSVKLPASAPGLAIAVINNGANSCQVFGAGTDTINNVATATGVALAAGKTGHYFCAVAGRWFGGTLT